MAGQVVPALSFTPIWCWAVLVLGKGLENRVWPTRYRGPVWMHAAAKMTRAEYDSCVRLAQDICNVRQLGPGWVDPPHFDEVVRSAFVGLFSVNGCEPNHRSHKWAFEGQFGWDIGGLTQAIEPLPAHGGQRLWLPTELEQKHLRQRALGTEHGSYILNAAGWVEDAA
jgi:hypothetical protein